MKMKELTLYNVCALFFLLFPCSVCEKDSTQTQESLVIEESVPVIDFDGNSYRTIKIGNQIWTAENLKSVHYSDGSPIQNYAYNNDTAYVSTYGKLYTWSAAMRNASSSNSNPSNVQGASPESFIEYL